MNKPKEKAFPDFMEMTRHGNTMNYREMLNKYKRTFGKGE